MKYRFYLLLLILSLPFSKIYSQNCTVLGCAGAYGSQTIDATVPDAPGEVGTCYENVNYKQAYWQFFYSASGGDFTQTYTPTSTGDPLDLDYIVFDMGISGPGSISCPVNTTGFTEVLCNIVYTPGIATGPGVDGTATTVAGHFYAVVIYAYQSDDPSYTFDISAPLVGGDFTIMNCPGILPVKLSSFDLKVNNCMVNLDWVAEHESNFSTYQVEYSTNGRTFQSIATIQANAIDKKYTWQHNNPEQGRIFYRLKMTDIDGHIEYSKIIAINLDCNKTTVYTYPNPVTDVLHVNISNTGNDLFTAILVDNNGKIVYEGSMKNGTNNINMTKLAKGMYILSLKNNAGVQNLKIIK